MNEQPATDATSVQTEAQIQRRKMAKKRVSEMLFSFRHQVTQKVRGNIVPGAGWNGSSYSHHFVNHKEDKNVVDGSSVKPAGESGAAAVTESSVQRISSSIHSVKSAVTESHIHRSSFIGNSVLSEGLSTSAAKAKAIPDSELPIIDLNRLVIYKLNAHILDLLTPRHSKPSPSSDIRITQLLATRKDFTNKSSSPSDDNGSSSSGGVSKDDYWEQEDGCRELLGRSGFISKVKEVVINAIVSENWDNVGALLAR